MFIIDHLGIAVKSLAAAKNIYEKLGLSVSSEETVEGEQVRVAMMPVGESRLELLEATSENSAVAKFIAKRGEGLHHICLRVPDLTGVVERLRNDGVRLVSNEIKVGAGGHRYVFVHPASAGGVLLELVETGAVSPQKKALTTVKEEIEEIVNRETRAWDRKDVELLMTILHPDMVWPFPRTAQSHDPMDWVMVLGRYDRERWRKGWQKLFDTHQLIHNHRAIRKIEVSEQEDGAFAVVDVDTLWRDSNGRDLHWKGRACKIYAKVGRDWKMTMQTGLLEY
jgi:methylmalonyl-CoA/ethylmalonyl-CoA epimerase